MAVSVPAARTNGAPNASMPGSSVYRGIKDHELITSPTQAVLSAADEFSDKSVTMERHWPERHWRTRPNQLRQTVFICPKVIPSRSFPRNNLPVKAVRLCLSRRDRVENNNRAVAS